MSEMTCDICGNSTTEPAAIVIGWGKGKEDRCITCQECAVAVRAFVTQLANRRKF
jgi:hypothetical protein